MIKGHHTLKCISNANTMYQRFMVIGKKERLMDL